MQGDAFFAHLCSNHGAELGTHLAEAEQYWCSLAHSLRSSVVGLHGELERLRVAPIAACVPVDPTTVHLQLENAKLRDHVGRLADSLSVAHKTSAEFEVHAYRAQRLLNATQPRRVLCECAEMYQRLHDRGVFIEPLNKTVAELHLQTLRRMDPDVDPKKGGAGMHLTPSARALWFFLYNNQRRSAYRMLRAVHRAAPNIKKTSMCAHPPHTPTRTSATPKGHTRRPVCMPAVAL